MPRDIKVDHPIMLGIVGDSAAGKTTLTSGIARILGPDRVATICTDDYHKYSRAERAKNGISALNPEGNYIDILEQHIQMLRQGRPILKPIYNHNTGDFDAPEYIEPRDYIILEGLLGYTTRAMRSCYDVKVYLEPVEDLCGCVGKSSAIPASAATPSKRSSRRWRNGLTTALISFNLSAPSPTWSCSSIRLDRTMRNRAPT